MNIAIMTLAFYSVSLSKASRFNINSLDQHLFLDTIASLDYRLFCMAVVQSSVWGLWRAADRDSCSLSELPSSGDL